MHTFNEVLDNIADEYQYTIEQVRESYEAKLTLVIRYHVAKEYPTFTGNIYFEINRDFLSIAVNPYFENTANADLLSNDLHKHLCTLSPNLLQCLDDVQISI